MIHTLAVRVLLAVLGSIALALAHAEETAPTPAEAGIDLAGTHGFDFLVGEWRVHHRRISALSGKWVEFEGTLDLRLLTGGTANIEEHVFDSPDGAYRAAGLRAWDPKSGTWSIWWLDERYPEGPLSPVRGRFENGIGTFTADYEKDGKPMRVRFIWSDITRASAKWQQATSADGGRTWQPNWFMSLQRAKLPARSGSRKETDFSFLVGEWQVQHRYLRGREWAQAEGTVSHRELTDGWANVENHLIRTSSGTNGAVGLRACNPKTGEWSIWWLDGRSPSQIDTPMRGRFENGIGKFFGSTMLDGKPVRVRFTWSDVATSSPRWQQDYSYDDGKTWEAVWTMRFRN
jgi:hypothetical protein